jgi:uncharacterized protein YkwD
MKAAITLILLFCSVGLISCSETKAVNEVAKPVVSPSSHQVQTLLPAINRERTKRGLPKLSENVRLARAAYLHAKEQMAENALNHSSLNGDSVSDRVSAQGYSWSFVAENLAAGRETAQETLVDWINSPGHNRNLFTKQATEFGAAYVSRPRKSQNDLGHFWVLVLAAPLE